MPVIRQRVKEILNRNVSSGLDPVTAVARGAAIQAAILKGAGTKISIIDVTPFSLGIKCWKPGSIKYDFSVLIPKHTSIPVRMKGTYTTVEDNQTEIRIEVFQGESTDPANNFKIGEFVLGGILPAKAGVPNVEVTFEITANCVLSVAARDAVKGHQCGIEIAESHLLSPAQIALLQRRFQQLQAEDRLEKLTSRLAVLLSEGESLKIGQLQTQFRDRLQLFETHRTRYSPTPGDNDLLLDIYRSRDLLGAQAQLALDRWDTLTRTVAAWSERRETLQVPTEATEKVYEDLYNEGDGILRRIRDGMTAFRDIAATYKNWLSMVDGLPVNAEGNPEDLARHFLGLSRYEEGLTHFRRLGPPLTLAQVDLGLEILARQRNRDAYVKLLTDHSELLGICGPDLVRPNRSVRLYASSVVWIQADLGGPFASGSGFIIGPGEVATNRHVILNEEAGELISPEKIRVVTNQGAHRVLSIHIPSSGPDDVAILRLLDGDATLVPLRLGFSELVEVGERIMTIGFPAPGVGGFEDNLYCNAGLINRIRQSELCSERLLEVSIELQGGISGAPIVNELGEVVGLLTFTLQRQRPEEGGLTHIERSFYAIPVGVLRRLHLEARGSRASRPSK